MKTFSALVAIVALVAESSAHYIFPDIILGGVQSSDWQYTRQTNNWQDLNPAQDVTSTDIRCYTSKQSGTAPNVANVAAGSTVTFTVVGNPSSTYHDGVLNVYMAKAPSGTDVSKWDGSGTVWFKIKEIPAVANGVTITFPATNLTTVPVTIPTQVPSGQYLLRVEHIALHAASSYGGAQFYISCAQINVTGGGSGTPGPLVAFPGAYTGNEPGILINIYYPIPTNYVQPGPAVWPAGGSTNPASSTTIKSSSTVKPSSTSSAKPSSVSSSASTGATQIPQYGQCGPTPAYTCVSPYKCTVVNPYYSQCL